ncbi:MAG: Methylenetetrahydrofolate dehydrogenase/methenyltetrahydrofolate cyclohydrolase [Chloroflexi bacterium]|nr:Methylenetetrahydrofolate dehydrogenase/methenyltetrahydrofolate cyclohydrolase [Chloroflexota bacterium]
MQDTKTRDERLILGREVAATIERRAATKRDELVSIGVQPTLAVLYRGEHGDATSYRKMIKQRAGRIGIDVREVGLDGEAPQDELIDTLRQLDADQSVHAVLVQNPIPAHMRHAVGQALSPEKDVEGLNATNLGKLMLDEPSVMPSTPGAILALIESRLDTLVGKRVTIINRSATVGRPLSQILLSKRATVTVCSTATVDLPGEARRAEVLVVAIGKPRAIGAEYIGDGAVVIDVGINADPSGQGICGDVDTEAALTKASAITPVPGGVGPVTTAVLLENVLALAQMQQVSRAPAG